MSQISDHPNRDESPNSSDLAQLSRLQSNANPQLPTPAAPPINPLLPLSAHYALLNRALLPAFAESLARKSYSIAYAAGVQFVEMALIGIPSHAYFDAETLANNAEKNSEKNRQGSSKNYGAKSTTGQCEDERQRSIQDAVRVATLLDELVRTEKVSVEACSDLGEARRLKRMADEAAARDDMNVQVCGIGMAEATCADWAGMVGDLGFDGANNGGRDGASAASPKPNRSTSIWDWAAGHADNACGRLVDEICSGSGRAPPSTTTPDTDGSAREAPFQDATSEEQFQADMERALYLSGLDSARVDRIRDAQDELAARRRERGRKHRRMKAVGRPRPDHVDGNPAGRRRTQEREGGARDANDGAARSDSDGRDGPEVESSPSPPPSSSVPNEIRSQHARRLEALHALADNCRDDFHALRKANRIRVHPLNTYQGRVAGSVNGCTVIAPLIAIAHLRREEDGDKAEKNGREKLGDVDPLDGMDWERASATSSSDLPVDDDMFGVSDKVIEEVIDEDAPSILPSIRAKLNLSGSAFIIPSDVHDFLMDSALLEQDQFVGVSGGNIFDAGHLESFVSALSAEDLDRPIGSTFFFHEHVVSLHRLVVKKGSGNAKDELWFDFIDSLPAKKMLSCDKEDSDADLPVEDDFAQGESRDAFEGLDDTNGTEENGVRLRCADAESLLAMIRWYAHSKLTDKDRSYISRCAWNDSNTDFDPRVFQAFIWGGCLQK